jgi:hypothetical protein
MLGLTSLSVSMKASSVGLGRLGEMCRYRSNGALRWRGIRVRAGPEYTGERKGAQDSREEESVFLLVSRKRPQQARR